MLGYRRCRACHRQFDTPPVFRADDGYCCHTCADGWMCTCLTEADLADDGVNGLGRPFSTKPAEVAEPQPALHWLVERGSRR